MRNIRAIYFKLKTFKNDEKDSFSENEINKENLNEIQILIDKK